MSLERLGIVAGEASGDLIGASLMEALAPRWPGLQTEGIVGPRMQVLGAQAWWPSERLSVFGYVDALKRLPELLSIRRQAGKRWLARPPSVFVGVDAPDFNFGLERRLRAGGIKTVHYVCPSLWAWRPERIDTVRAAADHVLCLFPFEPALLQSAGIPATFVGHPLTGMVPPEPPRARARQQLGLAPETPVLAVLPGSRNSEADLIGPAFLQAAGLAARRHPGLKVVLPLAPGLRDRLLAIAQQQVPDLDIQWVDGQSHAVLAAADAALVASGTATLEAALLQCPQVIGYRVSGLNHWRMKGKQLQPWVGLPNILAREFLVPELLQDACEPHALADALEPWLAGGEPVVRLRERCRTLYETLKADTATLCSDAIAQTLGT
ncbi:lipid-A-disaccharide synthase [Inhella gelatinilytica]|uniref:Lipid-A-disaccharide synthase n=1 Tax=Inhella gelatinilytica TaxID=2795030 RepID=A0A931IXH9_9BURK|nr:lipid-A-disaccharide synthase [Inhella gelatinilytica]MBH9553391.1 lipid-A-disaccharide synthase [Inhella gelatinilytica]